jgi:ABC-2 type transport system permease protein
MVDRRKKDLTYLIAFIAVVLIINILSSFFFTRFDFTKEKRYTLSGISKEMLGNLKGNMQITVYLEGDFPPGFKRLRNATRDLLSDLKAYSGSNLHYDFINPLSGNQQEQENLYNYLFERGIEPIQLGVPREGGVSQILIYPAALITYNGKQIPVRLLPYKSGGMDQEVLNNSLQNLEYAFASAIKKAMAEGAPRIGFTEGHNELTDLQLTDAMGSLRDGYEVGRVDLKQITFAGLDKLKLMVIPKPDKPFSEAEKYKIDYFVMHGGRVLWTIDNVSAELDSLRGRGDQLTFPKNLNLDDILFKYGVRINPDLVADLNCAKIPVNVGNISGQGQIELLPWIFYPVLIPTSQHPVVKNLDGIKTEFVSSIDTIAVKGINKQVILASSGLNRIFKTPFPISLQMVEQQPNPAAFQNAPKPVAVLLEGSFPSDFKGRPVPDGITTAATIPEKSKFTRMIVVADGDILKNQVSEKDSSPFPLGYDRYTQQQYGNKNFLLNVADYLTDDSGIIQLRTKEIKIRLLDKTRISTEKTFWQVLNIGLPILLIILTGIFQHYYRKRKYAH